MIPLIIAGAAIAGAGLAGGLASGSQGKSEGVAAYPVNPTAYQYGLDPDYYQQRRDQVEAQETGAQRRQGPQLDWSQADQDYQMALQARAQQQALAQHYQDVLAGKAGPSLAEQQLRAGQAGAAHQAAALAASARGGAGNAVLAQREAQRQAALGALAVNRDAGMMRAKEMAEARGEYAGLLSGIRGADMQSRGLSQQQVLGGAGVEMQQRALNDQRSATYLNAQLQMNRDQGQLKAAEQEQAQGAYQWAAGANQQAEESQRQRKAALWGGLLGVGANLLGQGVAAQAKKKKDDDD